MNDTRPRYSLFTSPNGEGNSAHRSLKRWSFRLVNELGENTLEATDFEGAVTMERLGLLAVVRGLEALDQPSHVILTNPSRVVTRGLHYGMDLWRRTGWRWERFGQMTLIRNADLWQRIDAAMSFHQLECRTIRVESSHPVVRGPHFAKRKRRTSQHTLQQQTV